MRRHSGRLTSRSIENRRSAHEVDVDQSGQTTASAVDVAPTQQRITDAALTLFADRGFAATGIRDLADAAAVSTAALYHYMGTKEDLLVNIMTEGLRRFAAASRLAVAQVTGPPRHVIALTRVHVATEVLQRRMSLVLDQELRSLSPSSAKAVLELRDDYESLWVHAISLGVETGSFQIADPALGRLAVLEMCNGVAHWFKPDGRLTLDEVCDRFSDMTLALLSTRHPEGTRPLKLSDLAMPGPAHEIEFVAAAFASYCTFDLQPLPAHVRLNHRRSTPHQG